MVVASTVYKLCLILSSLEHGLEIKQLKVVAITIHLLVAPLKKIR